MAAVTRKSGNSKARRAGWRWWQGMAFGLLMAASLGGLLLVVGLGAPIILSLAADERAGSPLTRTISLFTIAGSIEAVREFLIGQHDMASSLILLGNFRSIPIAWTAAAAGWFCNELACIVARWITEMRLTRRRRLVEAELAALRLEWSLPDG